MISFRVSDREFEMLKALAESAGARNVSEFARLALCSRDAAGDRADAMDRLQRDVAELKMSVQRVAEILEQAPPTSDF